jgi:uncharacterized protein (TIGR00730 family)
MTRPFSVAVYCSSSDDIDQRYFEDAVALGTALAQRGWRLVYGAGSVGLMGTVARATHAGGGQVFGIIPHALDRREVTYEACDELIRVETMRQRKAIMEENADAFIILPGGFGTFEEVLEVIVLKQLNYHNRPIVFVNTLGYWDPLITLFETTIDQRFARPTNRHLYKVVETPKEAVFYVANYYPQPNPALDSAEVQAEELRTALE